MVFIGYHSIGAYKLYSPDDDKLVININVLVDESKAIKEELKAIKKKKKKKKKNTWELVERANKKPIDVKWVYNLKRRLNVEIAKHKTRLLERDFLQKPSIDFN
ncbi:uncharacterized protein LOC131651158 [Vicia villosa]|uniref:uncharacterized protein LOC131651158 n=1 Tax=Vicia villosa TaxID=3911 RepID=UPI00273BDD0B|nr:uncharacterized protein LOC131651158 [Vicia villosa]